MNNTFLFLFLSFAIASTHTIISMKENEKEESSIEYFQNSDNFDFSEGKDNSLEYLDDSTEIDFSESYNNNNNNNNNIKNNNNNNDIEYLIDSANLNHPFNIAYKMIESKKFDAQQFTNFIKNNHTIINMQGFILKKTLLHQATLCSNVSCVKILLDYGANINTQDELYHSPFRNALRDYIKHSQSQKDKVSKHYQIVMLFLPHISKKTICDILVKNEKGISKALLKFINSNEVLYKRFQSLAGKTIFNKKIKLTAKDFLKKK